MKSGLSFLIAALRCEINELEQLARTSELVGTIGRLVHALQRERGLTNVLLASGGTRFAAERQAQIAVCLELEEAVRQGFDQLEADASRVGNGTRLFSRIAWVLPGLDALPDLRQRIGALGVPPADATNAFVKLVAGLLAVVFEAADGATDPEISRLLVAMFNFMQGKEFAGQERACGAAAFTSGRNDSARQQQWLHLIESQERCFQVFVDFSSAELGARWLASQPAARLAELERLRRIACAAPAGVALDPELSRTWFDCCTHRIDSMKTVEESLAAELRERCDTKTAHARAELQGHEDLLAQLQQEGGSESTAFFDVIPPDSATTSPTALGTGSPYGRQLERSILEMVQEQSQRLQAMSDELDTVRATLNERKLVERAKGLLMAHRRLSEEEAHKMLRQTAMSQNRRVVDVAESVLSMAEYLPIGKQN
ncbi:nitrate regulatory protein [Variovorax ginsengisoli]|uniref:ANTAR domain-containing protein n=1 Tax=Variovorax ginsengisoli TaxID=363844 RepID=A0ABT9SAW6_9BURK|nr:nitrate regulatory protein [Variovorax ginsengisoli]MDP9901498.1 hypothetical protein [Variovorax ginsengisoli]